MESVAAALTPSSVQRMPALLGKRHKIPPLVGSIRSAILAGCPNAHARQRCRSRHHRRFSAWVLSKLNFQPCSDRGRASNWRAGSASFSKIRRTSNWPQVSSRCCANPPSRKEAADAESRFRRLAGLPCRRTLRHAQILQRPLRACLPPSRNATAWARLTVCLHQQASKPYQGALLRWQRPLGGCKQTRSTMRVSICFRGSSIRIILFSGKTTRHSDGWRQEGHGIRASCRTVVLRRAGVDVRSGGLRGSESG